MIKSKGSIWIIFGTMLLLVALFIILYNFHEDFNGSETSNSVVEQIKSQLPPIQYEVQSPNDDFTTMDTPSMEDEIIGQYQEGTITENQEVTPVEETPSLYVDGDYYLGIITIPSLNLELPILRNLTSKNLKKAPCQYMGSISTGDLIVAGHNYRSHFGRLQELNSGDTIFLTDMNGIVHTYEVVQSEIVNGKDIQAMQSGADFWDLTLFTCTLSGQSRVTIRAISTIME